MTAVFLSHASADDGYAQCLSDWLVKNGFDAPFADHLSIIGGDKWTESLRSASKICRVVICIVTPAWLSSDDCFAEFRSAWFMGKRIIPLFIEVESAKVGNYADRLKKIKAEDQGFDLSKIADNGKLCLDDTLESTLIAAGLKASGAISEIGLDPEAFNIDKMARPCPFPGLESFSDEDADAALFFGRSNQIARSLEELRELRAIGSTHPYAIIGSSGSGKSSLLKAGILPRLRREKAWLVLRPFRPSGNPLRQLSAALARSFQDCEIPRSTNFVEQALTNVWDKADPILSAERIHSLLDFWFDELRRAAGRPHSTILMSLDQAEEFLPQIGQEATIASACLRCVAGDQSTSGSMLVWTVRTDSVKELQTSPYFQGLIPRCTDLRPMPPYRYAATIEGPAARYGLQIDPNLIEAIIEDVPGEDALPLLAFSLERLWRFQSADQVLNRDGYVRLGKLAGLIEYAAERALAGISPRDERSLPDKIDNTSIQCGAKTFVPPLTQISISGVPTRRVALLDNLSDNSQHLIEKFVDWGLVVKKQTLK